MPLLELDLHPKLVQYIKLAEPQAGIRIEYVRPPRLKLVGEERERILKVINEGIASRPNIMIEHLLSNTDDTDLKDIHG